MGKRVGVVIVVLALLAVFGGSQRDDAQPSVSLECVVDEGLDVYFNVRERVPGGRTLTEQEFGDGQTFESHEGGSVGSHHYARPGVYKVRYTVSGPLGQATDACTIQVPDTAAG